MPLPVRSGNPGLNEKTFSGLPRPMTAGDRMTLQGAINKSFLLLVVLLLVPYMAWVQETLMERIVQKWVRVYFPTPPKITGFSLHLKVRSCWLTPRYEAGFRVMHKLPTNRL